eukprot:scaffold35285_cov69-Phaeocystis_antarctica.AAC.1
MHRPRSPWQARKFAVNPPASWKVRHEGGSDGRKSAFEKIYSLLAAQRYFRPAAGASSIGRLTACRKSADQLVELMLCARSARSSKSK